MKRLVAGASAVVLAGAVALAAQTAHATPMTSSAATGVGSAVPTSSVTLAYEFLDTMMDKHASGSTLRLVQSYTGGYLQHVGYTDSVTYDDSLIIDAYLARASTLDVSRAEILGNSLLYVQAHDPKHDGRIRAAYAPKALTSMSAIVETDPTSDVGNMAWVGQALVQLYAKTKVASYLTGATAVANWIQNNTDDTRGAGGYTGGINASGTKIEWKSTEHNLDVFAFFSMLATESGNAVWTTRAAHAESLVKAMWDSATGRFWTGTTPDGVTINKTLQPEDVNTWSYLAFRNPVYAASITWDVKNLPATDGSFSGVSFATCDRTKVWFEGTAHLADALEYRNASGDATKAAAYLASITLAQTTAPNHDGTGIVAASHDGLSDCDGDKYYASLHTGATAWYIMAAGREDPFVLLG